MSTTAMKYDPNFPADLAISPFHHPQLSRLSSTDSGQNVFGSSGQQESIRNYGIAGRVWEASYPLLLYLGHNDWTFDPPFIGEGSRSTLTIVELGAGTGIVTSRIIETVATGEQDVVISTDLPEVCPLLEANLKETLNHTEWNRRAVRVRPLAWGNIRHAINISTELGLAMPAVDACEPCYLTHIVCSDLVYFPELLAPLLRTLIQLSSPPFIPSPDSVTSEHSLTIIMSYKIRSLPKETPFFSAFGLWFVFEPVIARLNTSNNDEPQPSWRRFGTSPDGQDFVFVARRRPESLAWHVPNDAQNLLDGVGAWGTDSRKGDDTFETLLLMGLGNEEE